MELSEEPKKLWKKSVADGEECMKKEQFEEAIAFFEFGLDVAIKFPEMFHPSDMARVHVEIACAQLKLKKYDSALDILRNSMSIEDNIPEGHTLMSQVFLEMGDNISASCSLLRGMEKCQLNEEQLLNFITMAATLLADLKLSVFNGDHKEEDIFTVNNIKPILPSSLSVWKDVIHRLWQKNAVAALAFITSGLPGPQASILEKAAAYYGCSCEEIEIQMIYEALSPAQLRGWGNLLAIFILEHGGTIAWQPEETSTIVIIKNSLKSGSVELLKWALKGGIDNNHLDNRTIFGDTALHFLVKSRPFTQLHEEMVHLLISHGALPNILDSTGNIPIHYIKQSEVPSVFEILSEALQKPNKGFKKRISDLKAKGNAAHQSKDHHLAIFFYEVAINVLEASQYDMRCDKAVLYSCMATEYTTLCCDDLACAMVDKRRADPIFHKPYWRIGKCLTDSGKVLEASTVFMEGLACEDMDSEQRLQILQEICSNLSTLSESQVNSIVSKMASFLPTSWPKLVETLSKTASAKSWDVIRCLVLGPPEKEVAKTIVNPGWKFADRFEDGEKLKVGYAMCLKAETPVLSTLAEVVDGNEGSKVREWATDLTLALVLQGAELSKLATSDEETGYHVALHMCCQTGKLGLLKYILSDARYLPEARKAVNKEARTLLHATCLEFGLGSHPVGEELVKLLCEKDFDHSFKDIMQKKAIQYLNPDSPMYQLLSAQQVANLQSSKELISLGNSEFKKGNNAAASQYYSQAINVIKLKLPPLGSATASREHSEARHELAVLLTYRAECYIKMEKIEEALNDAKESVSWDGNWYKGHLQVAQTLHQKNKTKLAVKAFCNAYSALDKTSTEAQQKEVLKPLIAALITIPSERLDRIPNAGFVPAELWAKVTYDFLCEAIEKHPPKRALLPSDTWDAANLSFSLFRMTPNLAPKPVKVNLKRLCTWYLAEKAVETTMELILYFLVSGSDHTALTFYKGDTYIHGAIFISILSGNTKVLDLVMNNYAIPRNEVNLQDKEGNTALHVMACKHHPPHPIPPLQSEIRLKMCESLLQYGINPCIKNNQNQIALDCLEEDCDHRLHNMLEKATEKGLQSQTQATQSDSESSLNQRDAEAKPRPKHKSECDICEEFLAKAKSLFNSKEKISKPYSKLVKILSYDHKDQRHNNMVTHALDMIVSQLSKSLSPRVPEVLLKVSQADLVKILEILASRDKWLQMKEVVSNACSKGVPCGQFGKNMSIPALIADRNLCGAENQRVEILESLVANGAQLPSTKGKEAVITAVKYNEFRVVMKLIEIGADPQELSLEPGDTPLHATLSIALDKVKEEKMKGYFFRLLEKLLDLYKEDPIKYSHLNPSTTDSAGNTLLHAAMKAKYSIYSKNAVKMLVSLGVSVDAKNNNGMAAVHYLNVNDRRAQYLRVASIQSVSCKQEQKDSVAEREAAPRSRSHSSLGSVDELKVEKHQQVKEKSAPKPEVVIESQNVKVKTITEIQDQVRRLQKITQADVKVAKAVKKRWLEITKTTSDNMDRCQPLGHKQEIDVEEEMEEAEPSSPPAVDDSQEEEKEEDEEEEKVDAEGRNLLILDNLDWEVECTSEVWRAMHDKRVPQVFKERAVKCIHLLACGEWKPAFCQPVQGLSDTLKLYQAKFAKGMRILWELAIAFSPRLSEEAEKRINEDIQEELAVHGGRIYTEIIRVWDIVFQHQKIRPSIQRIILSHRRGETCLIQKKLKGMKKEQFQDGLAKRYPTLFAESDVDRETLTSLSQKEYTQVQLYPPASANELEFHILKFYCFSSALVYNALKNIDSKIDIPFRVTDHEHAVINLCSKTPILLLGRSGTGKTICCIYRLWSRFLAYWSKSHEMNGDRWLPRSVQCGAKESFGGHNEEDPNAEIFECIPDGGVVNAVASGSSTSSPESSEDKPAQSSPIRNYGVTGEGTTSVSSRHNLPKSREARDENGDEEAGKTEGKGMALQSHVIYDHLHQLFVTKNQVLCCEVQKNFCELCHADDVAAQHIAVNDDPLPHRLQDINEFKYPLFLTSRQLILMLDASLPTPHFFERNEDGSLKMTIDGWGTDEEIFAFVSLDDSSEDEEDEYYDSDGKDSDGQMQVIQVPVTRVKKKDERREVTYEVFAHEIWSNITKKIKVECHPSLVWMEITSFIKGSFEALMQDSGYLDQERYEKIGKKQAPNFTGSRDQVYKLFLAYNHYKRLHNLYDEGDLVFHIYKRLKTLGQLPWVLHEVFVDETQDFTQAELAVLICLAQNPNNMFLTGDTAQSIMRGVSFRFSDLKTLFFHAKQSLEAKGKRGLLEVPKKVYQLTHNYRSHAGILSLASAVLDLLVEFFPESFDRLQKDQGLFPGPKPVVLESCKPHDLFVLLNRNKRKTTHIEFGAHQVILVVNEKARNSLPEGLSLGLVLTIFEAKGLEFDDVLLYNFFKDSQASKEWRVVTEFLETLIKNIVSSSCESPAGLVEIDHDVLQQPGRPRPLHFDPDHHKILNSELKQLYTAITRARVNVWIFDEDEESRKPMFEYFKALNLVRFIATGDGEKEDLETFVFAEKSTSEEWEKRGDHIMKRSLYQFAAKCYAIAGAHQKQNIANAYQMALEASQMHTHPHEMRQTYLKAANLFLNCVDQLSLYPSTLVQRLNLTKKAGVCLQNAHEDVLSAKVFEKIGLIEQAAILYVQAQKWQEVSHCYEELDNFNQAIKILDEHEMYDQAIDCLERYNRRQVSEKRDQSCPKPLVDHKLNEAYTVSNLLYKLASYFHRRKNKDSVVATVKRMPNVEDRISFLKTHCYYPEAAEQIGMQGRYSEAALILFHCGEVNKALEMAEKGEDNAMSARCLVLKAQKLIAERNKEQKLSEKLHGTNNMEEVLDLLRKARPLFDKCKDKTGEGECLLLESLLRLREDLLQKAMDSFFKTQPVCNYAGILECTEALRQIVGIKNFKTCCQVISSIESTYKIVQVLHKPVSAKEKNFFHMYIKFYGLQVAENDCLAFYPQQEPYYIHMTEAVNLCKEENCFLEKPSGNACLRLSRFLLTRMRRWKTDAERYIQEQLPKVLHCHNIQEGQEHCVEQDCLFLHGAYNDTSTREAVNLLSCQVRLEHAVQSGAESLSKIAKPLDSLAANLNKRGQKWGSVERLLKYLLPAGLPNYNMESVVDFCLQVQKRQVQMQGVFHQVKEYLMCQWNYKIENWDKFSFTEWIILSAFLSPLLNLNINVEKLCMDLERRWSVETPKWENRHVLHIDEEYLMFLARIHLEAVEHLRPDAFDPFESLQKFTKFTNLLESRGVVELMPDFCMLFFWLEVFSTLAICLAAKIKGNGHMILPDCYVQNLRLVNLNFHGGNLHVLLERFKMTEDHNLSHLHDCVKMLVGILSRSGLIDHLVCLEKKTPNSYLLLERGLVLALVLLLNVDQGNVPDVCEVPILRLVNSLSDEKIQNMPVRLANLVRHAKEARSYGEVQTCLNDSLTSMNITLWFCQWRWNEKRKDGIFPKDMKTMPGGGNFFFFDKLQHSVKTIEEAECYARKENDNEKDVENLDDKGTAEKVVELDEDEKFSHIKKIKEAEDQEVHHKSALIIFRTIKWFMFWQRIPQLKKYCIFQVERELFNASSLISNAMCGVCGVGFVKSARGELEESVVHKEEEESREMVQERLKQEHLNSEEHKHNAAGYETFRQIYRSSLAKSLFEIRTSFSFHQVKVRKSPTQTEDQWNPIYRDIQFYLEILNTMVQNLSGKLQAAIQERRWSQWQELAVLCHNLWVHFQEILPYIKQRFDGSKVRITGLHYGQY